MYKYFKRFVDFCIALVALIILFVPLVIVAIIIKLESEGPVIFKQERLGKDGVPFKIWKFRSMCVGAEKQGTGVYSYKGDSRITKVGKVIRATSIDELPQLVNILKGDMALIGPRPALTYHPWPYEQYTEHQKHMFDVLPGVTGWAQVNGRKEVPWPERIELNVWYARNMSLALDIKIFFMTIFKVATNANNENVGETGASSNTKKEEKMLNLMYITNRPEVARIAEAAGVDWIFIDMEWIGKDVRQGGLDTVQNHHTFEDVRTIKNAVSKAKVLTRINPIHQGVKDYPDSKEEIEKTIEAGADILMLPFFKTVAEVEAFVSEVKACRLKVKGAEHVKTCLLVETPEAAELLEQIVEVPGIDMIHFGLNDMHLALGMKFMFQLLTDGSVDKWAKIVKAKGIPFGFGGLASLNGGAVPGSMILKEHYRIGSSMVIVSRAFCNTDKMTSEEEIRNVFMPGIAAIRELEAEAENADEKYFSENQEAVKVAVKKIVKS